MIDIAAVVSAANAAFDLLKKSLAAHDEAVVQAQTTELEIRLREVNQAALDAVQDALKSTQDLRTMDQKVAVLERENRDLQARMDHRAKYTLVDLGRGLLAYRYDRVESDTTAPHYLCQPCMSNGKEVALQGTGRPGNYQCPMCKTYYLADPVPIDIGAFTPGGR